MSARARRDHNHPSPRSRACRHHHLRRSPIVTMRTRSSGGGGGDGDDGDDDGHSRSSRDASKRTSKRLQMTRSRSCSRLLILSVVASAREQCFFFGHRDHKFALKQCEEAKQNARAKQKIFLQRRARANYNWRSSSTRARAPTRITLIAAASISDHLFFANFFPMQIEAATAAKIVSKKQLRTAKFILRQLADCKKSAEEFASRLQP